MVPMNRRSDGVLGALVITACLASAALGAPDRIIAPHPVHNQNGVECVVCHARAVVSTDVGDRLRPDMETCGACHDVASDAGCATCHANVDEAGQFASRPAYAAQKFSHAAHLGKGMICVACHGDPTTAEPTMPGMADCRGCHATSDGPDDCATCHDGKMKLRPASHDALWTTRHGGEARARSETCAGCHTQAACQQCHAGDNVRPRVHPLGFAFSHAVAAREHELDCATCHGEPEFCRSCHAARRVLPRTHSRAGWVRLPDGGQHALDGALEIESCAACHDGSRAAPACLACHGGGQ
jgi:hypothetical protein